MKNNIIITIKEKLNDDPRKKIIHIPKRTKCNQELSEE